MHLLAADVTALELEITQFLTPKIEPVTADRYAASPAIMSITAGVGGMEAADFTKMLVRMYSKMFDRSAIPYEVEELQQAPGGIRRATFLFDQPGAYELLHPQAGTQRLTRVSPYNAAGKKQTSFAAIEVLPLLPEVEIHLATDDLTWDTFHSSGPGGQSVNTTNSAVRLTHKPTGLTVSIQGRSQTQNRVTARRVLAARLTAKITRDRDQELATARGARKGVWGDTARTFNLTGTKYVKDHHTGLLRYDTGRILDGDMGEFFGN